MKKTCLLIPAVVGLFGGCIYKNAEEPTMGEDLAAYLELCRETALIRDGDNECNDEWWVGASATTWERNASYKVVFADKRYLSFRAEEFSYNGGAHGGTKITVGTFDRQTGKRLRVADIVPENSRTEVLEAVRRGVIEKIGGADKLQGEVMLVENFFVAQDGIHFVFNEYEVACYAAGAIEVVVKLGLAE